MTTKDTSPTPPPDPIAAARALLAQEAQQRAGKCQAEINETLAAYGCQLEARPVPGDRPGQWAWQIVVVPAEARP